MSKQRMVWKGALALALAGLALTLDACSGIPTLTPQQQYAMACTNYDMALVGVTALGQAGVIGKPVIDQTILASHQFTPICSQPTPPANMVQVTQELTNAVTSGVLQEGLQYVKKNPTVLATPKALAITKAAK